MGNGSHASRHLVDEVGNLEVFPFLNITHNVVLLFIRTETEPINNLCSHFPFNSRKYLENVICSFNPSSVFEQLSSIHLDGLKIVLVFQKESGLGDWAKNSHFGSSNSLPELGPDGTQDLPFYQRNSPEQQWSWSGSVATDDSDDFEVATSCSSEQDSVRPASAPKPSGFANGAARKAQPKSLKSSDIR
jgi:hypothetical protein